MTGSERSTLRLADLKANAPVATRLMNVKVPVETWKAIGTLAQEVHASKTDVIVALLNEALAIAKQRTGKMSHPAVPRR